jgi:hypothetical protein
MVLDENQVQRSGWLLILRCSSMGAGVLFFHGRAWSAIYISTRRQGLIFQKSAPRGDLCL